jgi:site-specific DNA-methyltransferase (adenine-specific)/modification methylase
MKMEVLSPTCTIYCGDCKDLLKILDFDAVVTDPPYGINFNKKGKGENNVKHPVTGISQNFRPIHGDNVRFDCNHLLELQVGTHHNNVDGDRQVVIFGANHFCRDIPERGSWIVWDKSCGQGPNTSFTDAEFIWTNRKVKRCIYRYFWMGALRTGQDNANNTKRSHPSMKPVELMHWLIESARIGVGKVVLDPYMGVGSTGIACLQSGRKFIGIEIDPEYFEIAKTRLLKQIEILNDPQPQELDFNDEPNVI